MKVSELIELLQQMDGDAQVAIVAFVERDVWLEPVDVDDYSFEVFDNQVTIACEVMDV